MSLKNTGYYPRKDDYFAYLCIKLSGPVYHLLVTVIGSLMLATIN